MAEDLRDAHGDSEGHDDGGGDEPGNLRGAFREDDYTTVGVGGLEADQGR